MWILLFLALGFSNANTTSANNVDAKSVVERWVFVGDSLTEGYGLSKESAYPALLEKKLNDELKKRKSNKQIKIVNAGISGSTSSSGLSRMKWHLKEPASLVLVALGANDGLRAQPVEALKKNLNEIIDYAKAQDIKVVLAGMTLPQNYGKKYVSDFENTFKEVSKSQNVQFIPFLLDGVAADRSLNLSDGIHPNEKGHQVIAKKLFLFFKDLL